MDSIDSMSLAGLLRRLVVVGLAVGGLSLIPASAQNYGPNLLPEGSFDDASPSYMPWFGVDDHNNLHGIEGKQIAVDDAGHIMVDTGRGGQRGTAKFGPSVAVADLNGDGKLDIVMADSYGFFWFYPNSGTASVPVFTTGEIIPIWLGEPRDDRDTEAVDNVTPRIQLIDATGSGKIDIVVGTYNGRLFVIPNQGNSNQPIYKPTMSLDQLAVNTHKQGVLWSNFLAPFLTSAFSGNRLDLVMGEGTYSANSIYYLKSLNSSGLPAYDEDHSKKVIPGMGLEQITPVVTDWNGDGKPDVLCGCRTGQITYYQNTGMDGDFPTFAPGQTIKIGGQESQGKSITLALGDLTGNGMPNFLIGKDDGTIGFAQNTGKPGAPVFLIPPKPVLGKYPSEVKFTALDKWEKRQAYGAAYELVGATNPQLEPGFTFPEGVKARYALKFWVWPAKSVFFPDRYLPPIEDRWREHVIACTKEFTLKLNKRYRVHFWAKADKNVELGCAFPFIWKQPDKYTPPDFVEKKVGVGTNWTECSADVRYDNSTGDKTTDWNFNFELRFQGQPTLWVTDLQIQEAM